MNIEVWRLPQVLRATGMSRSWIYTSVADGSFPPPIKLGIRAIGWRRSDVERWFELRESLGLGVWGPDGFCDRV